MRLENHGCGCEIADGFSDLCIFRKRSELGGGRKSAQNDKDIHRRKTHVYPSRYISVNRQCAFAVV